MPDRLKPALPFLYALCLCALLSLVVAGRAEAHAALLASDPLDGAQLSLQPAAVELRFNEPVRPLMLRVLDRHGTTIASLAGEAPVAQVLRVALPAGGDGVYLASWRVASADDHPVAGSLSWRVGTLGANAGAPVAIGAFAFHTGGRNDTSCSTAASAWRTPSDVRRAAPWPVNAVQPMRNGIFVVLQ